MKKLLLLLTSLFVVLGLSACSLKDQFQSSPSQTSVSGILVEQTPADKESGTHFLVDVSGNKVAVRSLTINLSADEYLGNKVKASGQMNTTDNVFEINGLTVDEILSKNTKQTKQLEYKDTDAGFRLNYPDDWKQSGSKDKIVFTAPLPTGTKTAATLTIEQKPFTYEAKQKADGTLDSALEVYFNQENSDKKFDKAMLSKIGVDQMDALKITSPLKTSYTLYRSGLIYIVTFVPANPVKAEDENTFNKIVADFQFVSMDSNEADLPPATAGEEKTASDLPKLDMDMTTFESLPYQFVGKYPASWYYAGVKNTTNADVLHHYGFTDTVNGKEIISLDVLADGIPNGGTKLSFSGKTLVVFENGDNYTVYSTVKSRNFKFAGPASYRDLILFMAASLDSADGLAQQ